MIGFVPKNLSCLILKHTSPAGSLSSFSLSSFSLSTSRETSPALFDILVQKHHFPPELASRVASDSTHLLNPEKAYSNLSFFKESGFSNSQLVKIVNYKPQILAASLEDKIIPKFKIFRDLGFSFNDICRLITWNPHILQLSLNDNIVPSLSLWKGLLGSNIAVAKALKKCPRFLSANLESTVVPNFEFLKSCGVPMESLRRVACNFPSPFLAKPEVMRKSAEKVKEMGVDAASRTFMYGITAIASMRSENWEVRLQAFRDMGFLDSDILTIFRKSPRTFVGSMEKKIEIKRLLLATGKFSLSSIVNCPMSLWYSIENRYKPRLQILGILESRELIKEWPELSTVCNWSDDMFFRKFISPYLDEVSDVEVIKNFIRG